MARDMKWAANNHMSIDSIVYAITCIATLGLVYLIRVILSQAVSDGIELNKRWNEIMKS